MEGAEAEENRHDGRPPQLSFTVPRLTEIPKDNLKWSSVDLPIDILLLTVRDCEFLSCFYYLGEPFKSYHKDTGYVYFGSMGNGDQEKLKVALMICSKSSNIPGSSLTVTKAFNVLQPRAAFSVGICSGLNSEKVKLGDVVVVSELITPSVKTPVSRDTGNLSRDAGSGWTPPLKNPGERHVAVHRDSVIVGQREGWKYDDIIQEHLEAHAVETESEGLFTAAYVDKVEWMIIKGVASYGDPTQSSSSEWASFASTMAASVVASTILNDPAVFKEWPHYNKGGNSKTDEQKKKEKGENENEDELQLQPAIKSMKNRVTTYTEKSIDLQQPFRPNPGEGRRAKDLKIDDIYVNVVIHEGRVNYDFPEDRLEQLQVYSKASSVQPAPTRPQDIIDGECRNVLIVGRPGIGKTMLCTKLLRTWASDDAEMRTQFDLACLLKFRHLSLDTDFTLQELLARSETVESLDDKVWEYIKKNPTKVLLIFDGIDEFPAISSSRKDVYKYENTVEQKMPLHTLYNKLALGYLLRGATLVTTTRPTAVKCVKHLNFDRTVEIIGFSSEQVKEYVKKFTEGDLNADTKKTIWQHIHSNLNIFSLCYIPVNCFIICHCFLQIIHIFPYPALKLPTKITEIYSMTIKMFFFKHNRDDTYSHSGTTLDLYMYETFDKLQPENELVFKRLGEIAFEGIKAGRLVFESGEVPKEMEDCGLLHRLPDVRPGRLSERPKPQYCFLHLTIQEFFAAKYITDTMSEEEMRLFVRAHIRSGAWQVVMQFVAGLLKPDQDGEISDVFAECLPMETVSEEKGPNDEDKLGSLTRWPIDKDKHLALHLFRCIYEADVKQQSLLQSKIAKIGFHAVDFTRCSLLAVDFTAVVYFLKNVKGVLRVDLSDNIIDSLGCLGIVDLLKQSNSDLIELNLSLNNFGQQEVVYLCDALKHKDCKLIKLDLSKNYINDEGVRRLCDELKNGNCKLTKLNLSSNFIANQGAAKLCAALKDAKCKLTKLDLSNNNIGDEGVEQLCCGLTHENSKVTVLDLSNNNIGDQGAKHLCDALKCAYCKLTNLDLSDNSIGSLGASHLCGALNDQNCRLTKLSLRHTNVGDNGVTDLCVGLTQGKSKITELNLERNNIGDQGSEHLRDALKDEKSNLTDLTLNHNKIGDQGAKNLCAALEDANCKLSKLNLVNTNIGDQGAADLWNALTHDNCKIKEVNLEGNNIGDPGAKQLCEALKNENFKPTKLNLRGNDITDKRGAKWLSEALLYANCKVIKLDL